MAGFAKAERQRVIDAYLNETGRNMFVPREFLAWLKGQPDHEAYPVFFSLSDEQAAHNYRVERVRQWVAGLRVTVNITSTTHHIGKVTIGEYKLPGMVSPMGGRKSGGGYLTASDDPAMIYELRRQAAVALESWLERFGGVLALAGGSEAPIKEIVGLLSDVADAA